MASREDADLTLKLGKRESEERIKAAQRRMLALRLQLGGKLGDGTLGPPLCVVFEGWDASGKGGAIRRLVSQLDPRHVRVAQFAAPTYDERRHHFLSRFWPALPGLGGMTVFDRSWYGRVLVEHVEHFATKDQYTRAYDEIVQFEQSLAAEGMIIVKFWLEITEEQQVKRFRAREHDPLKRWKLTDEDWRNLAHRVEYEKVVDVMLDKTDHPGAPWHVIAAESKPHARVAVIETVIAAAKQGMRAAGMEPTELEAEL